MSQFENNAFANCDSIFSSFTIHNPRDDTGLEASSFLQLQLFIITYQAKIMKTMVHDG